MLKLYKELESRILKALNDVPSPPWMNTYDSVHESFPSWVATSGSEEIFYRGSPMIGLSISADGKITVTSCEDLKISDLKDVLTYIEHCQAVIQSLEDDGEILVRRGDVDRLLTDVDSPSVPRSMILQSDAARRLDTASR